MIFLLFSTENFPLVENGPGSVSADPHANGNTVLSYGDPHQLP